MKWKSAKDDLSEITWKGVVKWENGDADSAIMTEFGFCQKGYGDVYSFQPDFWLSETEAEERLFTLNEMKIIYEAGQSDCGEFGKVHGFESCMFDKLNIEI
jgi:hypothetical protein